MLKLDTRKAILELHGKGHGMRAIANALLVSRNALRKVVRSGRTEVSPLEREAALAPHLGRIRSLHASS